MLIELMFATLAPTFESPWGMLLLVMASRLQLTTEFKHHCAIDAPREGFPCCSGTMDLRV